MKKLLIADASEEFRLALLECLQESYTIRVCHEGHETLRMMESFKPDVVILDLLLPGLDGVTLLQEAAARDLCPTVLATTRFYSDYMIDAMERLGVSFVMVKPCEVYAVVARLMDLTQLHVHEAAPPDICDLLDNVLMELHVPTHLRGFPCLREALLEAVRNPGQQVTKTLYPAVAKVCGENGEQVERAIRNAIKKAWENRDESVWRKYFYADSNGILQRPTNSVFICTVANRILTENAAAVRYLRKSGS